VLRIALVLVVTAVAAALPAAALAGAIDLRIEYPRERLGGPAGDAGR
jgi:hypothetical protein